MSKRNFNLDIIRSIAVLFVICVHFLLNTGFYQQSINGMPYIICIFLRVLFMSCVPLFIILSGTLLIDKKINKKYYLGIIRILITYSICSLVCFVFKNKGFMLKEFVSEILSFKAAPYAWYVNFYIGFFLLIPFLNIIYNSLNSKKQKKLLIFTLIFVSIIPSLNIYNVFPNYWQGLYPFLYYFLGAYIKEYKNDFSCKRSILIFLSTLVLFSIVNYFLSKGKALQFIFFSDYGSVSTMLISTSIFVFFYKLKLEKTPNFIKKVFYNISKASFAMYLVSYCFDSYLYKYILNYDMGKMLLYFIPITLTVFIGSLLLGIVIEFISEFITKYITITLLKLKILND